MVHSVDKCIQAQQPRQLIQGMYAEFLQVGVGQGCSVERWLFVPHHPASTAW